MVDDVRKSFMLPKADRVEGSNEKVSEKDQKKLDRWNFRPSDEEYLKHQAVYDDPRFYDQETGEINWPPNDGFKGPRIQKELKTGTILDRYGDPSGNFLSPVGIPYEKRALAPHSDQAPYTKYVVKRPFLVESGVIAPWFTRPGGGIQYFTGKTELTNPDTGRTLVDDPQTGKKMNPNVANLIRYGYLEKFR